MKYFFIILLQVIPYIAFAQYTPGQDRNLHLDSLLSDEFNNIDTTKWYVINEDLGWGYATYYKDLATIVNDNYGNRILRLQATSPDSTAGIQSKKECYQYGYYEMRAKLPGFYDSVKNSPSNHGFWTAFWCYHQKRDPNINSPKNNNIIEHFEIDIVEPYGDSSNGIIEDDARTNEMGHHLLIDTPTHAAKKVDTKIIHNLPVLYEDYHVYAAEFLPDKIVYYFDDSIIHIVYDTCLLPHHLMRVVMNNQILPQSVLYTYTPFPQNYDIDYFRFYTIDTQNCTNSINIISDSGLTSFPYGVWGIINIGNSNNTVHIPLGYTVLRVSNYLEIQNIDIPLGSDFSVEPTKCF